MAMAFVVWLCALPFVLLLAVPWFGLWPAATTALALLAAITLVCWRVCAWSGADPDRPQPRMPGGTP